MFFVFTKKHTYSVISDVFILDHLFLWRPSPWKSSFINWPSTTCTLGNQCDMMYVDWEEDVRVDLKLHRCGNTNRWTASSQDIDSRVIRLQTYEEDGPVAFIVLNCHSQKNSWFFSSIPFFYRFILIRQEKEKSTLKSTYSFFESI